MVKKGKMPATAHDFSLKDMEFSNSGQFFMVKAPPGKESGEYLFYPGCQLSASSPEHVEKAYKYLLSGIKEGVGLMLGCCGAPADWAGRGDLMADSIERLRAAWAQMGKPIFILACSSCCGVFEKYLPEIPFISLWEIFERYGLPEIAQNGKGRILNIHDACSTRHNQNIQESIRNIALKLGYQIKELKYTKEKTKCCGYGGLVYFANRDQARDFVKDRVNESDEDLLVYCAMCKDLFVEGGKRTYHILDLIFEENPAETASKKMPNLSQRHVSRAQLKKKLLKELWHEDTKSESIHMENLLISEEVWRIMDERYILLEDIEKVIKHAQESGERIFNPEDMTYTASLRINNVTFWVRYIERDGAIEVVTAYSHRIKLLKA